MTERIVSLLPSATEILCELGLADALVGISHACDYPHDITDRPILTESIVDPSLPSAEIDSLTKQALARGESLYRLNEARLRELQPTLVVTQALCDVCAISYPSVARAVGALPGAALISLEPGCIEDIFADVERVGAATGRAQRAAELAEAGRAALLELRARLAGARRPRVLALEWFEPAYYGGHWVPEQVEWGGGACVLGAARARSEGVSWETIAASDPDVVVCMPCGYDAPQTRELLRSVEQRPEWNGLRAVREGRVLCVDANAYFSRPSLRVVTGAQIIGHILHPDRVPLPEGASRPIWVSRSV